MTSCLARGCTTWLWLFVWDIWHPSYISRHSKATGGRQHPQQQVGWTTGGGGIAPPIFSLVRPYTEARPKLPALYYKEGQPLKDLGRFVDPQGEQGNLVEVCVAYGMFFFFLIRCWCLLYVHVLFVHVQVHTCLMSAHCAPTPPCRCASPAAAWAATTAKSVHGSCGVLMCTHKTQMWWQSCYILGTFPQPLRLHLHPFKNFVQSSKCSQACNPIPHDPKMDSDREHGLQKPRAVHIRYVHR